MLLALLAAGCGPQDMRAQRDEQAADTAGSIAIGGWSTGESEGGVVLTLTDARDVPTMTMRCTGDPAEFVVRIIGFTPIGSEERLSLGLGNEIVTMVADPEDRSGGVVATTHDPAAIAGPLRAAGAITANYGAQNFGSVAPPAPEAIDSLIESCG